MTDWRTIGIFFACDKTRNSDIFIGDWSGLYLSNETCNLNCSALEQLQQPTLQSHSSSLLVSWAADTINMGFNKTLLKHKTFKKVNSRFNSGSVFMLNCRNLLLGLTCWCTKNWRNRKVNLNSRSDCYLTREGSGIFNILFPFNHCDNTWSKIIFYYTYHHYYIELIISLSSTNLKKD